ncbi:MAG: hypothetical protein HKN11_03985 [Rhizobiales bacterium]|nr:hypothetical protein [Hyphomicrobiales bacterium]
MGDVVAVKVDGADMASRQIDARPVALQQRTGTDIRQRIGRRIGGKILSKSRVLRKI